MAASELSIINIALIGIGEATLTSETLNEGGRAATLARTTFDLHRDALLEEFPWKFARRRYQLAISATSLAWGPGNAYPLPPDTLRPLSIQQDREYDWDVEIIDATGAPHLITTLTSPINVMLLMRVTNPSKWSPLYQQCLVGKLQTEWAFPLGKSRTVAEDAQKRYDSKLRLARQTQSQQGTGRQIHADLWDDSRGRGVIPEATTSTEPY